MLSKIYGVMLESLNFIHNCHVDSKKQKFSRKSEEKNNQCFDTLLLYRPIHDYTF